MKKRYYVLITIFLICTCIQSIQRAKNSPKINYIHAIHNNMDNLNFLRKVNDMREIVLIKYYNVCFYLAFQRGKDEINKQCLVKRIESGAATNMKEIAGWCDAHKIPFATKFKYRKDFPLKANIWNLYSYFRFLYTRKIVLEKYYICQF